MIVFLVELMMKEMNVVVFDVLFFSFHHNFSLLMFKFLIALYFILMSDV